MMNTSKSKKANPNIIEIGEEDKKLLEHIALVEELNSANRIIRDPEKEFRKAKFHDPNLDPKKYLEDLLKRRDVLRKELKESDEDFTFGKHAVPDEPLKELPYDPKDYLRLIFESMQARYSCPDIIAGKVSASGFRHYLFHDPGGIDHGYCDFWPKNVPVDSSFLAGEPYNGSWEGSTGAYFYQTLTDRKETLITIPSHIVNFGVFQFPVPAPKCDSLIIWQSKGIVEFETENLLDASFGKISTKWLLCVNRPASDFPQSLNNFAMYSEGGLLDSTESLATITRNEKIWYHNYIVPGGVQSQINLGCLILTQAGNGTVSTLTHGEGDYFEFENGVSYLIIPLHMWEDIQ